ncbi:MAG: hypothetical protein AB4368_04465 [Xenococcaceae cyanobacterium]
MKINSVVLPDLIFKLFLGVIILAASEIDRPPHAVASTLKLKTDDSYGLEAIEEFSLKLNRNFSNSLQQELLGQNPDFSESLNLVIEEKISDGDEFIAEINILFQSQIAETNLFDSLLGSLSNLELRTFSNNLDNRSAITVLPRVNYQDIYQDIYDFDITLANSLEERLSRSATSNRANSGNIILTRTALDYSYSTNYAPSRQNNFGYRLFNSEPQNISNNNFSLLVSSQQSLGLTSGLSSPSGNSSLVPRQNTSSFINNNSNNIPLVGNTIANNNKLNYKTDYSEFSDLDSRLREIKAPVSIPSFEIEAYELKDFKIRSNRNDYPKPEHQQNLEEILEKQQQLVERQREKLYEKIKKLREKRQQALEKQAQEYRKRRQKQLQQVTTQQRKLQQQQSQYRF